ncbi:MoxR family ATPase, partial [Halobacterium sp. CBA1126]|uniref:AAA family ATPase n=1 Tax=Halobacterium sp. CBA1126 TaxID=2668074 RepID=UPI0012FBC13E
MDVTTASDECDAVLSEVERAVVADREFLETVLVGFLADGHVLLEDVPGTGKTLTARSVATALGLEFSRIQFTPDLLPADVLGTHVFNEKSREFEFQPGPVFANVLLADEINRAPPKTQSALLEAMEEAQVTADGETRQLPDPFVVVATQNAVERDRAYELPVAELDRFMKKLQLGYPDREREVEVLDRAVGDHPIDDIEAVASVEDLRRARAATAGVTVERPLKEYVTELARYTRDRAALGV